MNVLLSRNKNKEESERYCVRRWQSQIHVIYINNCSTKVNLSEYNSRSDDSNEININHYS